MINEASTTGNGAADEGAPDEDHISKNPSGTLVNDETLFIRRHHEISQIEIDQSCPNSPNSVRKKSPLRMMSSSSDILEDEVPPKIHDTVSDDPVFGADEASHSTRKANQGLAGDTVVVGQPMRGKSVLATTGLRLRRLTSGSSGGSTSKEDVPLQPLESEILPFMNSTFSSRLYADGVDEETFHTYSTIVHAAMYFHTLTRMWLRLTHAHVLFIFTTSCSMNNIEHPVSAQS